MSKLEKRKHHPLAALSNISLIEKYKNGEIQTKKCY